MSKIRSKHFLSAGLFLGLCANMPALAQDASSAKPATGIISEALIADFQDMMSSPVVIASVKAANEKRKGLSQAEINDLDQTWRAERESDGAQPYIAEALGSPVSTFLLRKQAVSKGLLAELFVMDLQGLNVGQSSVTSDFWQGDEDKFLKTVPYGAGTVFVDEFEYNDEFGIWLAQVNFTLEDEGAVIGSATIEVNLTELERRRELGL